MRLSDAVLPAARDSDDRCPEDTSMRLPDIGLPAARALSIDAMRTM